MMVAVYRSKYRHLLRVEKKPILQFLALLSLLAAYRIFLFKTAAWAGFSIFSQVEPIPTPWQMDLMVFWEDMIYAVPLAIMSLTMGLDKIWKKCLYSTLLVLASLYFGIGHAYQGLLAVFLLSFYVPFSIKKGHQFGFGTVMICHVLYDLSTRITASLFG